MRNAILLLISMLLVALSTAGCANKSSGSGSGNSGAGSGMRSDFGVISKIDDPVAVAAVRTFYVAPNNQLSMQSGYVAGAPLNQVFADRIAARLVKQGLTQAPPDMADMTVTFSVQAPTTPTNANAGGSSQGLGYADQLLDEAKSLETKDNFLDNSRLDFRIRMTTPKSAAPIWRGGIAGVMPAGEDTRSRLLDTLDAVDRLLDEYPKVAR